MRGVFLFLGIAGFFAAAITSTLHAQTNAPRITAVGWSNGVFSLAWTNVGTNAVTIERRTSLTSGSWTAIASNNTSGAHTDTNAPGGFVLYRVVTVAGGTPPAPTSMALIPAGSFSMGNALSASGDDDSTELPVHTVNVSAFYMDRHEVTKALWDEVRAWGATNGYTDLPAGLGKAANHPVHGRSWHDVVKWSNARSQKEGLEPTYTLSSAVYKTGASDEVVLNVEASGYRLPTEAEWEKAARGRLSGKRFPWGDTITHSEANYDSSARYSCDVSPTRGYHPVYATGGIPYFSPVGSFAPNGYGLYDMAGNAWEWCWDWHDMGYYASSPLSDPSGPPSGAVRVLRGGSWDASALKARVAFRYAAPPGFREYYVGFRCVRR